MVVLGLMGTGKTTVGSRLATLLQRPFVDSDRSLEAAGGASAAERAATSGLDALHTLEFELLMSALASPTPSVIAAAGSVLDRPGLVDGLAGHIVVGCVASDQTMRDRFDSSNHRPPLDADPLGSPELRAARLARMALICERIEATDLRGADEIAADLAGWVATNE